MSLFFFLVSLSALFGSLLLYFLLAALANKDAAVTLPVKGFFGLFFPPGFLPRFLGTLSGEVVWSEAGVVGVDASDFFLVGVCLGVRTPDSFLSFFAFFFPIMILYLVLLGSPGLRTLSISAMESCLILTSAVL